MAVYVDNMDFPYRGMKMCHMIADTSIELYRMADAIGVDRKWAQSPHTPREHFDICRSKKVLAIRLGAIEISWHSLGRITGRREHAAREAARLAATHNPELPQWTRSDFRR